MIPRPALPFLLPTLLIALLLFSTATAEVAAAEVRGEDDASETTEEPAETEAPASPGDEIAAAPLVTSTGKKTTFGEAFGDGHKVVLFTKPWSETNAQLIGELSHFRIRLNRGGLKSGVVFLRSDLAEASRLMADFKGRVKYTLDPDGRLARQLGVKTMPSLMLVDPDGRVRYAAPLLAQDLVRQVAAHYNQPEKLFPSPRASSAPRRPGVPPAKGNVGRYSIR